MSELRVVKGAADALRFKLVPFDELNLGTARAYLIKGLIPRIGLTVLWGPPKSGKSFWAFDAMMHVALGWEYRGRRVARGPVVYLACEGAAGYSKRAEAFRLERLTESADGIPFYLIAAPVNLVADAPALIASIAATLENTAPAAVTIDTLNRTLPGSESSDEDMAAYVRSADAIRDAFKCAVLIVHHSGVDASRPRGHTSLTGAADAQLSVKRSSGGSEFTVTVEWMKDGPEGEAVTSRLRQVELGLDDDGDPITSCVVEEAEPDSQPAGTTRKLSDRQKNAVDALRSIVSVDGASLPGLFELPDSIRAVPTDKWRDELLSRGVIERDSKNPRADFKRLKEALQARSVIGEREGSVWLV